MADALLRAKRANNSMNVCQHALSSLSASELAKRPHAINLRTAHARALCAMDRMAEALPIFDEVLPDYRAVTDRSHFLTIQALQGAADHCAAAGEAERAAAFRSLLPSAQEAG